MKTVDLNLTNLLSITLLYIFLNILYLVYIIHYYYTSYIKVK